MNKPNVLGKSKLGDAKYALMSVGTIAAFIFVWWLVLELGIVSESKIPHPLTVLSAFIFKLSNAGPDGATLLKNIFASLRVSLSGLVLAAVIGIPLGVLMGWYRVFDRFMRPLFELMRPIPPIAWIPLTILWFGVGIGAKAFIIFISAFVPCVINSYTGIRQTNPVLINVAKTFGAKNFYIFLHVGIPSAVPMIFAGLKVALANSWATLVAAEMLASSAGLGYMINMARNFGRIDVVIVGMICIGLLGGLFTWLFSKLERFVLKGRAV